MSSLVLVDFRRKERKIVPVGFTRLSARSLDDIQAEWPAEGMAKDRVGNAVNLRKVIYNRNIAKCLVGVDAERTHAQRLISEPVGYFASSL